VLDLLDLPLRIAAWMVQVDVHLSLMNVKNILFVGCCILLRLQTTVLEIVTLKWQNPTSLHVSHQQFWMSSFSEMILFLGQFVLTKVFTLGIDSSTGMGGCVRGFLPPGVDLPW
jgi:hypothetical protein